MRQLLLLFVWLVGVPQTIAPPEPAPVVRAVLFYSPTCGHCHYVIEQVLPPLMDKYGAQLEIIGIDVSQQQGSLFFQGAMQKFQLQQAGVPLLVIGNEYLIGSGDIPDKFPGLIETYLAQGGVDFPDIPDLCEAISASESEQAPTTVPEQAATAEVLADNSPSVESDQVFGLDAQDNRTIWERVALDPAGNGLAIVTLLGMLAVVVGAVICFPRLETASQPAWQVLIVPLLCLIGFGVAGYLAYVETAQVTAVCGPVGDCNTVQQSEYARLFGILPIGVLGLAGYIAIILAWTVSQMKREPISSYAALAVLAMTAFGLLFSIYLTFLEPFVIGATCAWCLTSAILMTALFWLLLKPGKRAWETILPV